MREVSPGVLREARRPRDPLLDQGSRADVSGTVYDWNGRTVNAGGITTFATHSVISENRLTVIPDGSRCASRRSWRAAPTGGRGIQHRAAGTGAEPRGLRCGRDRLMCNCVSGAGGLCARRRGGRERRQAGAGEATRRDTHHPREERRPGRARPRPLPRRGRLRHRGHRQPRGDAAGARVRAPAGGHGGRRGQRAARADTRTRPARTQPGQATPRHLGRRQRPGPRLPALLPAHRVGQTEPRTAPVAYLPARGDQRGARRPRTRLCARPLVEIAG